MRWKSFCNAVLAVATETGCEMVVTLGALLGDVPHTRGRARHRHRLRPAADQRARAPAARSTRAPPASSACCTTHAAPADCARRRCGRPVPHYVAVAAEPAGDARAARALRAARRAAARPPRSRPARRSVAGAGRPRDPRQRRGDRLRARARGPRRRRGCRASAASCSAAIPRAAARCPTPTTSPPRWSASSASRTARAEPIAAAAAQRRAPTAARPGAPPWCGSSPACCS